MTQPSDETPPHTTEGLEALAKVVQAARGMLEGRLSYIEGSGIISGCQLKAKLAQDPDADIMSAIASETDALPMGDVRSLWNPQALAKLDSEIADAEAWAKQVGEAAAKNIVARFGDQ